MKKLYNRKTMLETLNLAYSYMLDSSSGIYDPTDDRRLSPAQGKMLVERLWHYWNMRPDKSAPKWYRKAPEHPFIKRLRESVEKDKRK